MPRIKTTTEESKAVKVTPVKAGVLTAKKPKTGKKPNSVTVDVYDAAGKVSSTMTLPEALFGVKVNRTLIAQAVRVFLANQRSGTASTKTRGEVQGSTRKIYRQKGTGRARHGGVRAPIFVHGGIAHGPRPHDFHLSLPQKMRRAALASSLTLKAQGGAIKVVDGLTALEAKTKVMVHLLNAIMPEVHDKKILFVLDSKQENVIRAVRNLDNVTYEFVNQLNTYEVMKYDHILFVKGAIETLSQKKADK